MFTGEPQLDREGLSTARRLWPRDCFEPIEPFVTRNVPGLPSTGEIQ